MSESRTVDTVIRGYHAYQHIWTPVIGEELACRREPNNAHDPNAVAVWKGSRIVGHLPKDDAEEYSIYLKKRGTIKCQVTGNPVVGYRDGLEVPCRLTFMAFDKLFEEAMKYGHVKSQETKILICGAAGSGKTCFRHLLLGEPPPITRTSTPLAVRPVTVHCIDTNAQWKKLSSEERNENLSKAIINLSKRVKKVKSDNKEEHASSTLEKHTGMENSTSKFLDTLKSVKTDKKLISLLPCYNNSRTAPLTSFERLQIIDSGGQPEFLELLPIFVKDLSACIFVFKLSDELSECPTACWYSEGEELCSYQSDKTHEQLFQFYIRTVHSQKSSSHGDVSPNIVVLGTHRDEESKCAETREEKNRKLANALSHCNHEVLSPGLNGEILFGVNAKSPEDEDKQLTESIRQSIVNRSPKISGMIPQRWYALEIMLEELACTLNRGVLSWNECFKVASSKFHFTERSLTAALKHLNGLSMVFYLKDVLPNVVFINPQIPLDKVTELVKQRHDIKPRPKVLTSDMQEFYSEALVTADFLKSFKEHYCHDIFTADDLVKLFRKLFVLADYSRTKFFIPALLKIATPEELIDYRVPCDSPVPPLVVEFSNNTPLLGVFCTLTCFLLSERNRHPGPWALRRETTYSSPTFLRRNCIQFEIASVPHGVVTVIDAIRRFEFHIASGINAKHFKALCSIVHDAVRAGLRSVNEVLCYMNSEPKNVILCPCGIGDHHTAKAPDDEWVCARDSLRYDDLNENQRVWLHQSSGQRSSEQESGLKGDASPTMQQLQYLDGNGKTVRFIKAVEGEWTRLADLLGLGNAVESINQSAFGQNAMACRKVLSTWLQGAHRSPVTWKTLVDVVGEMELINLKKDLEIALGLCAEVEQDLKESLKRKRSAKQSPERAKRPRMQ